MLRTCKFEVFSASNNLVASSSNSFTLFSVNTILMSFPCSDSSLYFKESFSFVKILRITLFVNSSDRAHYVKRMNVKLPFFSTSCFGNNKKGPKASTLSFARMVFIDISEMLSLHSIQRYQKFSQRNL